jgi:sugar lactone lactonase YvrE
MTRRCRHSGSLASANLLAAGAVVAALAVGIWLLARRPNPSQPEAKLPPAFVYDVDEHRRIDPNRIGWEEVLQLSANMDDPRGLAVEADGPTILLVGDRTLRRLSLAGRLLWQRDLPDAPTCVADGPGETILVGGDRRVLVIDGESPEPASWPIPGERSALTSIAVDRDDVYVADAAQRVVHRFSLDGEYRGAIGAADPDKKAPGLVIPSGHLDVAAYPDGLVRVVNPGRRQIEAYTPEGFRELAWGKSSMTELAGFCGCCNPTDIAVLPDGAIATAEKGICRVKVYEPTGEMRSVVAGPASFTPGTAGMDLACLPDGRLVVLDPARKRIRLFAPRTRDSMIPRETPDER